MCATTREKQKKKVLAIGLMSGTSADGIDAASSRIDFSGSRPYVEFLAFHHYRMPAKARKRILAVCDPRTDLGVDEVCQLNFELGELFARAACSLMESENLTPAEVDVIGSHGQTVYHIPCRDRQRGWRMRSTLQLGDPSIIAERTGVTTVAEFRARDMAAGGEGAPLVPLVDDLLFGGAERSRIAQNIGGIANATFLPARGSKNSIIAFDTGPGNMVVDALCEYFSGGKQKMDRGGRMARSGVVDEDWLKTLLQHPYFKRKPPKSTGRETFGRQYAQELVKEANGRGLLQEDIVATVSMVTVQSIVRAYEKFLLPLDKVDQVILSGGGAKNDFFLAQLRDCLPDVRFSRSDDWGIPSEAKEALAFAVLAAFTLAGRTGNVPSVTGADQPVPLGVIAPVSS